MTRNAMVGANTSTAPFRRPKRILRMLGFTAVLSYSVANAQNRTVIAWSDSAASGSALVGIARASIADDNSVLYVAHQQNGVQSIWVWPSASIGSQLYAREGDEIRAEHGYAGGYPGGLCVWYCDNGSEPLRYSDVGQQDAFITRSGAIASVYKAQRADSSCVSPGYVTTALGSSVWTTSTGNQGNCGASLSGANGSVLGARSVATWSIGGQSREVFHLHVNEVLPFVGSLSNVGTPYFDTTQIDGCVYDIGPLGQAVLAESVGQFAVAFVAAMMPGSGQPCAGHGTIGEGIWKKTKTGPTSDYLAPVALVDTQLTDYPSLLCLQNWESTSLSMNDELEVAFSGLECGESNWAIWTGLELNLTERVKMGGATGVAGLDFSELVLDHYPLPFNAAGDIAFIAVARDAQQTPTTGLWRGTIGAGGVPGVEPVLLEGSRPIACTPAVSNIRRPIAMNAAGQIAVVVQYAETSVESLIIASPPTQGRASWLFEEVVRSGDLLERPDASGSIVVRLGNGAIAVGATAENFGGGEDGRARWFSDDGFVVFSASESSETALVRATAQPGCPGYPECRGDFNGDGGFDGDDAAAFFAEYEAGGCAADLNCDGGTDGADVEVFYELWGASEC